MDALRELYGEKPILFLKTKPINNVLEVIYMILCFKNIFKKFKFFLFFYLF